MRRLRNILTDQRGNTAIIFGLAVIPLLALGGGAVDFAQRARIHGALQSASDTAALAAARFVQNALLRREENWEGLKAQAATMARDLVFASLASIGGEAAPDVDIEIEQEAVRISAHYDMDTNFLGVIGIDDLPVSTLAEVNLPDPILVEVALVLDYSLSMRQNDKYQRMTAAARDFLAKIEENRGERSKAGIVPFSEFVYANMASGYVRDPETGGSNPWDGGPNQDGSSSWDGDDDDDDGTTTVAATCLLNRDYPYSVTNDAPTGAEASRWRQADPDSSRCRAYEKGDLKARDLTNDFDDLREALADMEPVGWTNIALAAEMGWHMLSAGEPFDRARDFSDPYVRKILILLTDGVQTVEAMGPTGETSIEDANRTTAELCENAKASGISLYTIAYDVDDTDVYDLMSACASSETAYFEVHDSSGIAAVFEAIYAQISETAWLSR